MLRFLVALAVLTLSIAANAQDWVEHGGAEYNCSVLNGILADYGDRDLSRSSDSAMTVGELFAIMFPSCPPAVDARMGEASVESDASPSDAHYSFSSDEYGLQPVLGPVTLPAGIYVFTATTAGFMSVIPQSLSGDCGLDLMVAIFNLSHGQGDSGAQSVVDVEADCNVLFEIGNATSGWTMDIVAATDLGTAAVTGKYSTASVDEGMRPVLGPLALAKGVYVFTATTAGFMALIPQSLSDDCGLDLMVAIFNLSQGQGASGAQSVVEVEVDCNVLLDVSNTTQEWTLDIRKSS